MLRYFYDRNAAATSMRGKKGATVKISDIKRELKAEHDLSQAQVVSNLTYLLDREWVKEIEVKKEVRPRGGTTTVPSVTSFYEISAKGIDRIEGGSPATNSRKGRSWTLLSISKQSRTSSLSPTRTHWSSARSGPA
jgi:hypothetical protein